jgi:hypothetical protein
MFLTGQDRHQWISKEDFMTVQLNVKQGIIILFAQLVVLHGYIKKLKIAFSLLLEPKHVGIFSRIPLV